MTCGSNESGCVCVLDRHDPTEPHLCACGGSWQHHADGRFTIHAPPGIADGYEMSPLAETMEYPITFPDAGHPEPLTSLGALLAQLGLFIPPGGYSAPRGGIRFVRPPGLEP